ncbi:sushi, von Willebrand factor type A, EGF and pentraxin domain-containing protein 1-like isoform X2 [Sycon ciliatum]|uniref:sushi, von Willebrand factor type A, EGF and pentraxin domain-containing protein 1-like isoform X2 n=1 Tax=Sycon ciliatum TaxID=27933 RepID=UPI0031F6C5E1
MSNHQHLLSANNLVLLVVGVLYWISASANGQCRTSDDCIAPSGLTRCNVTSGKCDCTLATFRHGLICDKVCTDTGLKGHCVKGVCNQSDFSFDLYFGLCKCDRGWSEDDTGRCTIPTCNRPCQNGGACVEPNKCRCVDGFTGDQCEMKLRCTVLPTPDRGRTALDMQNGIQYQTFDCDDGYVVNGRRVSICENSRWNPPTPPTCVDQDECSAGLHQCERHCGMCKNTLGSYVCNVSPENADLVYDAEKGRCCQRGEACGEISCFPYQQLSFGTLRYSRPLWSTTAKVAVLTSVSVECDASRGLRLPDNAVTTVKCTKSGLYDNILSDCLPPPTQGKPLSHKQHNNI